MAEEKTEQEWAPDREVTLDALRIVDMVHEGKPTCRLCGQVVNVLDRSGLCSKVSVAHKDWRAGNRAESKAGAR